MAQRIEQDQIFLTSLSGQLRFHYLRGKGHLRDYLWNHFQWYNFPRWRKVAKFPLHVDIEISSLCNMDCPMCYTRTDIFRNNVRRTLMDLSLFKKIVDECARFNLFSIRLSLRGEAFMNPDLVKMLKYAKDSGIREVSSLTNGLNLDGALFERLIDNGLDWLTLSIDGWGEKYESIRKPAKFQDILRKMRDFAELKRKRKSQKPVLRVQTIWPAIQEDPRYFYEMFKPYADEIVSNPLIDFLREDTEIRYLKDFCCSYPWQRLSIGADGTILMCHCDEREEAVLGNAREDSLFDIWHGEGLNSIRRIHAEHKSCERLEPCKHCAYARELEEKCEVVIESRKVRVEKYAGRDENIKIISGEKR
ncbi:MAG: radical SAM/SPASM domain-containing protein [Candidatus Omnitrophica bacterium]|nr:radical SAM/SPASM domain-containing protein [Candidatus Omnitrophota bacterium]